MKYLFIQILSLFSFFCLSAQELRLDYIPEQKENVSNEDYRRAVNMLKANYQSIKEREEVNVAHYWNTAVCYLILEQSNDSIYNMLLKSKQSSRESFCVYVKSQISDYDGNITNSNFYLSLKQSYTELTSDCKDVKIKKPNLEKMLKEKENYDLTGLNSNLIDRLIKLMYKDQLVRYQSIYNEEQRRYDDEVRVEMIKIFDEFGYPGKSSVGEHYKNYACLILEHGIGENNLSYGTKYFPLVTEALAKDELDKPFVRMLIDRIHWLSEGKQIFGSHAGLPFDDELTIQRIKNKYKL